MYAGPVADCSKFAGTDSAKASVSKAVVRTWHRAHVIRGRPKGSSVAFISRVGSYFTAQCLAHQTNDSRLGGLGKRRKLPRPSGRLRGGILLPSLPGGLWKRRIRSSTELRPNTNLVHSKATISKATCVAIILIGCTFLAIYAQT